MNDNYYDVLEISETATPTEIKKAFRRLSMLYHPDKNNSSDATNKFQKISEAYETLSDPEKKRGYDLNKKFGLNGVNGLNGLNVNGLNVNGIDEIFSSFFGFGGMPGQRHNNHRNGQGQGQRNGQMNGHEQMNEQNDNEMNESFPFPFPFPFQQPNIKIFHNGINISQALQKPSPIIKKITVSIDKILTGYKMPIDIERWLIHNDNKVFEKETLYVDIPKGIDDGEIIVLREKGNILNEDLNLKGDIKLFVKMENNTDFKRNGLDLIYDKTITLKEALCGFTFELKSINDITYTINNNPGNIISNNFQKVIPQMGLIRDEHIGNLIINFQVKFPEKLSIETINELRKMDI